MVSLQVDWMVVQMVVMKDESLAEMTVESLVVL
jgi:hypothetical protein